MLKDVKAAIFDMDGTLVDSMWVWGKIDIDYLANRGYELPSDLRENIEHLSFVDTAKYFKERFNLADSVEEIMNEWTEMAISEYSTNVKLKPGAKEFLIKLKSSGVKIALATSNARTLLELTLKNNDVFQYFDVIATTDEVKRGKDFPDIYLLAAERVGVSPEECIVFEDILPAVKGAKSAGMKVIAVHDSYSDFQREAIMKAADHYIVEYFELTEAV